MKRNRSVEAQFMKNQRKDLKVVFKDADKTSEKKPKQMMDTNQSVFF